MFYGIVIRMDHRDHAPPHSHAEYGEHEIVVAIKGGRIIAGEAPARVVRMVLEWADAHRAELMNDWELCRENQLPRPIEPLE